MYYQTLTDLCFHCFHGSSTTCLREQSSQRLPRNLNPALAVPEETCSDDCPLAVGAAGYWQEWAGCVLGHEAWWRHTFITQMPEPWLKCLHEAPPNVNWRLFLRFWESSSNNTHTAGNYDAGSNMGQVCCLVMWCRLGRLRLEMWNCLNSKMHRDADVDDSASMQWQNIFDSIRKNKINADCWFYSFSWTIKSCGQ